VTREGPFEALVLLRKREAEEERLEERGVFRVEGPKICLAAAGIMHY